MGGRCPDSYQLLNDPVKVGGCFFKERDLIRGSYCMGPPRKCHDCSEKSIFTVGRELAPTGVIVGIPREWPFSCLLLLRLGRCPPFYPLSSISVGINDSRHLVERTLPIRQPASQFLWLRCHCEPLELLDAETSVNGRRIKNETVLTPFKEGIVSSIR